MSKRTLPQQRPTQPQPMRYQGQQRYPHPYGRTIQTQGYQLPFRSRDIGTDTPQLTWSLNRDLQRQRRNTYPHPPSLPQGQLQRKSYAPPQLQQPSRQQQSAHNQSRTNQEGQLLLSDTLSVVAKISFERRWLSGHLGGLLWFCLVRCCWSRAWLACCIACAAGKPASFEANLYHHR
jgi:hypothetical protein